MSHVHVPLATPSSAGAPRRVQRACQCGSCEKCRKKKLQRKAHADGMPARATSPAAFETGGSPLSHALRARLEPRFGTDFSAVRIHDDAASHRAARELHANAFTWGQHIHFGASRYRPDSSAGLHLLAHELTHTVQQRGSAPVAATDAIEVDAADTPLEREADAAADAVMAGRTAMPRPTTLASGLVQRDAIPGDAEIDLPDASGGGVRIRRTMRERRCDRPERVPRTESTPRDRVFEWDEDAHALLLRYTICRGQVRLSADVTADYSDIVNAGTRLLEALREDPASATDLPALGRAAVDQASLGASGAVTLAVSGVLLARVGAEGDAGTGEQTLRISGELTIAPNGSVTLRVTGGAGLERSDARELSRYTLGLQLGTRWFRIGLDYLRESTTPAGGGTSTTDRGSGELRIPIPGTDIAPFLRGTLENGPDGPSGSIIGGIGGTFGTPSRPPRVDCYECRCPPPRPEYACTPYGTRDVVDTPADTQRPVLLYQYDATQPADPAGFDARVGSVASLAGQGYSVRAIRGYASPEGTVAYNQALAQRRADHAHGEISLRMPPGAGALPAATGIGELLGESSSAAGSEARNSELTSELRGRLAGLGPDERLELLGIEGARRGDPVERQQALDDIEAFVQGRDARGRRLAGRARWERVFPFLRRVEVELHRDAVTHTERVDRPEDSSACDAAQRAHIDRERPIPPAGRMPARRCDE
ncbi:DUF4157 domain-containing protein [Luteimonas viscosa]|uniref:DUF4157 domain-containing protein n=1 Tax=Luteimonas viscosa TaxID=1132694 RepID=A0A5D4XIR6_9GAMM|nr:DUF4157 domain-containing protein [Luteimonas viscosa]TYT23823.1 DUF4157 domain-containing protein [Luteimonas viscosa]